MKQMPDTEKVIKGLHDIAGFIAGRVGFGQARNFLRTIDDAIELLKEQDGTINELQNAYGYLQKQFFEVQDKLLKEQEAVEPFHKCIGKDFSLIEDSHFDYCPYCGKPITWAKQEGR